MSERVLGREPVELIEIITPKCANTHGTAPCTATETGNLKCFNTRNTCNDVDNFQARPLSHLTPDLIANDEDSGTHSASSSTDFIVSIDLRIGSEPEGILYVIGGTSTGLYIGFDSNNDLRVRCGDGGAVPDAATAELTVDMSAYLGGTYTLIVEAERDSGITLNAYIFDPIELELYSLGSDTATDGPLVGTSDYAVGTTNGSVMTGEVTTDYNGTLSALRAYYDQPATLFASQNAYRERYFFDNGRKAKPADNIYILPMLQSASAVGTRLNLLASDDRYEPLGRRSFMDIRLADAPHSDYRVDPYRTDRDYDPLKRSTFWNKWLVRNKFGRTRALVRRYAGYKGEALSAMKTQTYVVDRVGLSREQVSIKCRDFLSLTEFRRAQVPAPTDGKVAVALTDSATTLFAVGDVTGTYPTSGTLRIGDELMTYTARAYDAVDDETDFTGLVRGTDGSTADEHDVDDGIQLCRRYTKARVADVLEDLIVNDAQVPAQVVDLAKIQSEDELYLSAYLLTTVISEPTGVDRLVGELSEQCAFYLWWNERRQIIDMKAIVPTNTVDYAFTQSKHIVNDSLSTDERPKERLTTISLLYNPRDFAGDLEKTVNFKNQLLVLNSTSAGLDQYGDTQQIREIYSRWLTTEAMLSQTGSRMSIRYADVPRYAQFMLDAKDRAAWVGDLCSIEHDYIVDARGDFETDRRWLIIEAEETEPGHAQKITCVDITLDGEFYFITPDGTDEYSIDGALFTSDNYAFITDDNGLNDGDGTVGATIG